MLYFKLDSELNVLAIFDKYIHGEDLHSWHDFDNLEIVEKVAESATKLTGELYIPINNGIYTSKTFDVIKAPYIGEPVSKEINGDLRPCGYIKTISKSLKKITTTEGYTFYRKKQTGQWLYAKYFSLISGHITEFNLHV